MLCLLTFWLLLRQTLTERQEKLKEDSAGLSDVFVDEQKKKGKNYANPNFVYISQFFQDVVIFCLIVAA